MPLSNAIHRLTEAEYLGLERRAGYKSEFFEGEMFAMVGGSPVHSLIAANLIKSIGSRLPGRPCVFYPGDLRLKVESTDLLTYADLSVVCGPLRFAAGTDDTVVNPTVIVEVLSDSTEAYDRGKKFENYRQMPSLREYLLVSQREPRIEHFIRQEAGDWILRDAAGLEAVILVSALGTKIPLAEVFANVVFAPTSIRPATRQIP